MEVISTTILLKYFPGLSHDQLEKFIAFTELITEWNKKINLLSRKDTDHLLERHILHSLAISKVIQFAPGTKIVDIGTGGGFPGIPLSILFPRADFHLADSIGKKIIALRSIIQSMNLRNVSVIHSRVEAINETYDFGVCRAVAPLSVILHWMKGKIRKPVVGTSNQFPNGLLCLKGGDLAEEIKQIKRHRVKIYNLSDYFEEEFFITKKLVYVEM